MIAEGKLWTGLRPKNQTELVLKEGGRFTLMEWRTDERNFDVLRIDVDSLIHGEFNGGDGVRLVASGLSVHRGNQYVGTPIIEVGQRLKLYEGVYARLVKVGRKTVRLDIMYDSDRFDVHE